MERLKQAFRFLDGPTEVDGRRKRTGLLLGSIALMMSLLLTVRAMKDTHRSVYEYVVIAMSVPPSIVLIAYVVVTHQAPVLVWELTTYAWTIAVLAGAYQNMMGGYATQWQVIVVFLDISLVNQIGKRVTNVTISITCTMLILFYILSATDSALPDTVTIAHICDCDNPPCRGRLGYLHVAQDIVILLADFYLTRGFAVQVLEEKTKIQTAIDTAEDVAVCLGAFDLDAAEALLQAGRSRTLPAGLTEALQQLLLNLRMYEPYLPKSCLPLDAVALPDTDTDSSCISTANSSHNISTVLGQSLLECLVVKRCTLVVFNLHNTTERIEADCEAYCTAMSHVLQKCLREVQSRRGIVDVFVCDKIFASFNASRLCGLHATKAVDAVKHACIDESKINCALATGRAHCGDLGCKEMKRFSVLGRLPFVLAGVERAGREFGLQILCSTTTQSDVCIDHELRLVPSLLSIGTRRYAGVVGLTLGPAQETTMMMYEVVQSSPNPEPANAVDPEEEWMYTVQRKSDSWALYDSAVRAFLRTGDKEAAVRQLAAAPLEQTAAFHASLAGVASKHMEVVL